MPFRRGSISFARFRLERGPTAVNDALLERIANHPLTTPAVGAPPEIQTGWTTGRHILDTQFDPEEVLFGSRLLIAMRVDTNRVPAELRQAYRVMAQRATGSSKEGREDVEMQCQRELAEGRHRRSKLVPVLWDVARRLVLAPAMTDTAAMALSDLFAASVEGNLVPQAAGSIAAKISKGAGGGGRDHEDLTPSPFTPVPPAATVDFDRDPSVPTVPWSPAGAKDFLGNEFLVWLWATCEEGTGVIETNAGEVAVALENVLDMQCAWDVTGRQSLRAVGPCRLPEAGAALAPGKWPRKVGMIVAARGEEWSLTFQADRFLVTGAKIASNEPMPPTERERLANRVDSIFELDAVMIALYARFLEERTSGGWKTRRDVIREWVRRRKGGRVEMVSV